MKILGLYKCSFSDLNQEKKNLSKIYHLFIINMFQSLAKQTTTEYTKFVALILYMICTRDVKTIWWNDFVTVL